MWAALREHLDLEDPVNVSHNKYLGCAQKPVSVIDEMIDEKREMMMRLLKGDKTIPELEAQLTLQQEDALQQTPTKPKKTTPVSSTATTTSALPRTISQA